MGTTKSSRHAQNVVTTYTSSGTGDVAAANPGFLMSGFATNGGGSTVYLWILDQAGAPANSQTTNTLAPIAVPAGTTVPFTLNEETGDLWAGHAFASGLVWASSSSVSSVTLAGSLSVTFRFCQ